MADDLKWSPESAGVPYEIKLIFNCIKSLGSHQLVKWNIVLNGDF